MAAKKLTDAQALSKAKKQASDLRRIREGLLANLDNFTLWVTQIEDEVKALEEGTPKHVSDARYFCSPAFAKQVIERLDDISHVHTGSTLAMYFREAKANAINAVVGDDLTGY